MCCGCCCHASWFFTLFFSSLLFYRLARSLFRLLCVLLSFPLFTCANKTLVFFTSNRIFEVKMKIETYFCCTCNIETLTLTPAYIHMHINWLDHTVENNWNKILCDFDCVLWHCFANETHFYHCFTFVHCSLITFWLSLNYALKSVRSTHIGLSSYLQFKWLFAILIFLCTHNM